MRLPSAVTIKTPPKPPVPQLGPRMEALPGMRPHRSSVAWDPRLHMWIAVGPNGSDVSLDDGRTWKHFDSGNWNALSLPWVVGPKGQIASLDSASRLVSGSKSK